MSVILPNFMTKWAKGLVADRIFDRLLAGFGAMAGVAASGALTEAAAGQAVSLIPPIGASAVLVFAVPASPLAQPYAVIGGNIVSALVGLAVGAHLSDPWSGAPWLGVPWLVPGVAVGLAILAMALTRCLHPPGGAVALMSALLAQKGGASALFALDPVGLESLFLVMLGWAYHRFSAHSYPHLPAPAPANIHETAESPPLSRAFPAEDIDAALAQFGDAYDISRADLENLLQAAERCRLARRFAPIAVEEIFSRDLLCVTPDMSIALAREIFYRRALRCAPVINADGVAIGMLTPVGLASQAGTVGEAMSGVLKIAPGDPALDLVALFASGAGHEALAVDSAGRPLGLVTQTDLLALLFKMLNQAPD